MNQPAEMAMTVDYTRLQLALAIPKIGNAMLTESEDYTLPVVTCEQSSAQMPVVQFLPFNPEDNTTAQPESGVSVSGTCITIRGDGADILFLKDRLIYEYYDIMSEVKQ
jgi:hypothetical protein